MESSIPWRSKCISINDFIAKQLAQSKPTNVILHANWKWYHDSVDLAHGLSNTINYIKSASPTSNIIVIGSVPQWYPTLPVLLARSKMYLNQAHTLQNTELRALNPIDAILASTARAGGAKFISAIDIFCHNESCNVVALRKGKFEPVAWDLAHLTEAGADILAGDPQIIHAIQP
jgi:hypothetical protein